MSLAPFTLVASHEANAPLQVPPGHEGFVVSDRGYRRLDCGQHRLRADQNTVFLVPVGASHQLDPISIGSAMLQGDDGRWQPLRVIGRLAYRVARPHVLVERLARDHIYEPREFEQELARMVEEVLSTFLDGESWKADRLVDSLEFVSGELMRHVEELVAPMGIDLQTFELAPASTV